MPKPLLSVLAIAMLPLSANAVDEGIYLGAALGRSYAEANSTPDLPDVSGDLDDVGWRLYGGYRFDNFLGLELGYSDYGNPDVSSGDLSLQTESSAVTGFVLGHLPIGPIQLYGKAGFAFWDTDAVASDGIDVIRQNFDGTDFAIGVGASFNVGSLGFRLDWERIDVDAPDDLSMISAGLQITF